MAKKRRGEEVEDGSKNVDKISQLPQQIQQHILYFLPQEDAVRTSVLSKSWRHLWSTRPNIVFSEKVPLSVLDHTLKLYHDQNLSIQQLTVWRSRIDSNSVKLLQKWIPIVTLNMGVQIFKLSFSCAYAAHFPIPSELFQSESLQNLSLDRCKLNRTCKVFLKHLHTLDLSHVDISEETLEAILSTCPWLETVSLVRCTGFRTVRLNRNRNLKYFKLDMSFYGNSIEQIDVPNIRTIEIWRCRFPHRSLYFPHLTRLILYRVQMPSNSFTCDFVRLEEIRLIECCGIGELNLKSRSEIKILCIMNWMRLFKATIDAPSIVNFNYVGSISQPLSFTSSIVWKSVINLKSYKVDATLPISKLYGLLRSLSESEISLQLTQTGRHWKPLQIEDDGTNVGQPVVVESLKLGSQLISSLPGFLRSFFRVCRPRYIEHYWYTISHEKPFQGEEKEFLELLGKSLEEEQRDMECDLDEVRMEVCDSWNSKEWQSVESTSLLECNDDTRPPSFRFRLKWRELIRSSIACGVDNI